VNTIMNLWGTQKAENFLTTYVAIGMSRKTLLHGANELVI
jgi:hypothetical protein